MKIRSFFLTLGIIAAPVYGKIIKLNDIEKPKNLGIRTSSYPYITGDTFRAICDHIIDETQDQFNTELVKPGDIIFIRTSRGHLFFNKIHPFITNPYILSESGNR